MRRFCGFAHGGVGSEESLLERAGIVHGLRAGRQSLFELDPKPLDEVKNYLQVVSEQWDQALARLRSFVED